MLQIIAFPLSFGQTATPAIDGAVVQYHITRAATTRTLSYDITDETTGSQLASGTLESGDQGSTVDSSIATTYQNLIKHYTDLGYVVSSEDTVPSVYGSLTG